MDTLLALVKEPDDAKELVKFAINLASDLSLNLKLLYVQDPANYPFGGPGMTGEASVRIEINMENLIRDAEQKLTKLMEEYGDKNVSVEISTETGIIKPIIEKLLADKRINMLIQESIDRDGFWTQNSTYMDIARNVKCPVWIIPEKSEYRSFREIIYATDYQEEDLSTLQKLIGLTQQFSPNITALHITQNMDFEVRIKKAGFQEMVYMKTGYDRVRVESLMERSGDDIGQMIKQYAGQIHADLIVVLKENRPFIERLFTSSVTRQINQKAEIPVLIFHELENNHWTLTAKS
jgi:nucleotide-binding universal stress UspA family protein